MRSIIWIFIILLGLAGRTDAQALAEPKKWDVSGSAALFYAKPQNDTLYQDDWYFHGRYAVAIGHYWTEHLKTEIEYATSGEGRTYFEEVRRLPPDPAPYPYVVEAFHRLEQGSVRMVWQFGENSWVHPYVSGGIVGDRARHRFHTPMQYVYPSSGSGSNRLPVVNELNSGPTYEYRLGVTAGAGAKFYMSPNAFFNTGIVGTYSKPAATVSLLAGFGFDF